MYSIMECDHQMLERFAHLEHDGRLLLVNLNGEGPCLPVQGRRGYSAEEMLRLPTPEEAREMGIEWSPRRVNFFSLGERQVSIEVATPDIPWPSNWAWKDSLISDDAVDPVARESVYRTLHRVVSKVVLINSKGQVLMAKVTRGFFTGHWTLPGGFVDYGEHPRDGAVREAREELGIEIQIADHNGESGHKTLERSENVVREAIFNDEGIDWISFTYKASYDGTEDEIVPKDDEIEEARWFDPEDAISKSISVFDRDAIAILVGEA